MPWATLPAAVLLLLLAAGPAPVQAARLKSAVQARTPNVTALVRGSLIAMRAVNTAMLSGLVQDAERYVQCCCEPAVGLP
jgi:hypothetical protein